MAKRGPGRPPFDPSGKMQKYDVYLSPAEVEFLQALGGSVNKGARQAIAKVMAEALKESEEKIQQTTDRDIRHR